jgi:hypothetical protein
MYGEQEVGVPSYLKNGASNSRLDYKSENAIRSSIRLPTLKPRETFGKNRQMWICFSLLLALRGLMLFPMNSLNSQTSRPIEDLDAVIGRFQAWTMTQTQTKPSTGSSISEISYEQALRATARYHRAEAQVEPVSQKSTLTTQSAPEPTDLLEEPKVPLETVHGRTHSKARRKVSGQKRSTIAEPETPAVSKRPAKKVAHSRESFAQVLRQQTGVTRVQPSTLRSSSLTVRLSPDESTLIKARADEAQLSTSAYLRQCALEVEALRSEVRETLAKFRTPRATSVTIPSPALPPVASPSRQGMFTGLRKWMIRRLGGQQIDAVC